MRSTVSSTPSDPAGSSGIDARPSLCIGLLGPYASRNLGDTAIQMAAIEALRARHQSLELIGICPDPVDTVRSLRIAAFPLDGRGAIAAPDQSGADALIKPGTGRGDAITTGRWRAFRRIVGLVRSLDLLVVSGGGQLDDFWGGTWSHPFALFAWTILARLHGVRVAFVGIGLDRLSNRLSRFLVLSALRLAHYRSFRDAGTLATLRSFGLRAPSGVAPDLAFGLALDDAAARPPSDVEPCVVVNPISSSTWAHGRDDRHDVYLQHLAAACEWCVEQGFRVRIVCSQEVMDRSVAVRLAGMIRPACSSRVELRASVRVSEYVGQVRSAEVVIASRLHGAILGLVAGVPVVAISPLPKVTRLMHDIGMAEYNLELRNFSAADLIERIRAALQRRAVLRRQVRDIAHAYRAQLAQIYDDVLALVDFSATGSRARRSARRLINRGSHVSS